METYLMVYAKSHILNEAKAIVAGREEYENAAKQVADATEQYDSTMQKYENQARQLRNSSSSEAEFKDRFEELQMRAREEIDPATANMNEAKGNFEKVEHQLISEYLSKKVIDELGIINDILKENKIENVQSEKPIQRGKIGLAGVLNLHFETDKKNLKELKKKIEKTHFRKIEVFIENT